MEFTARLLTIFLNNLLPMFLLIGTGYLLQRRFKLDINSLNKLNIYAFVPGILFAKIVKGKLALGSAATVLLAAGIFTIGMMILGRFIAGMLPGSRDARNTIGLSSAFSNAGNFGLPLMELSFGAPGVEVQSMVMMSNNLLNYTAGMFMVAGGASFRDTLKRVLSTPVVYVIVAAGTMRYFDCHLPGPIMKYVDFLGNGLIPVALLTLGAQLAETGLSDNRAPIGVAVFLKLLVAPLFMMAIVYGFSAAGFLIWQSMEAKVLILGAAIPSAVNTVLITTEFKARPEVAAGAIFVGTLVSSITLAIIMLALGL